LTLLYFNFKGWGSNHRDYLYVAAMCSQAAMPIYAAPLLGAQRQRREEGSGTRHACTRMCAFVRKS
jgi:hypothetical protein